MSTPKDYTDHLHAITLAIEHGLDTMRAELETTRNAVRTSGAEPRALVDGAGVGVRVSTSPGRLMGWSVAETAGAAAKVHLRDGADRSGDLVATITLPANGSQTTSLTPAGVSLTYGLFVEVVAGAIEGTAFLGSS